jgi:hypothetical protein
MASPETQAHRFAWDVIAAELDQTITLLITLSRSTDALIIPAPNCQPKRLKHFETADASPVVHRRSNTLPKEALRSSPWAPKKSK